MLKKLASLILPSNDRLARKSAEGIRDGVNGTADDKKAVIAKYATLANECAAIGTTLTEILKDGHVDEMETETIAGLVKPLIVKAREVIGV